MFVNLCASSEVQNPQNHRCFSESQKLPPAAQALSERTVLFVGVFFSTLVGLATTVSTGSISAGIIAGSSFFLLYLLIQSLANHGWATFSWGPRRVVVVSTQESEPWYPSSFWQTSHPPQTIVINKPGSSAFQYRSPSSPTNNDGGAYATFGSAKLVKPGHESTLHRRDSAPNTSPFATFGSATLSSSANHKDPSKRNSGQNSEEFGTFGSRH